MPANGCVSPHHNWPNANARLMLARPRPVDVFSVLRNSPIDWRAPIVTANVPPAARSTSQNAVERAALRMPPCIPSVTGGRRRGLEQLEALLEQTVEIDHLR